LLGKVGNMTDADHVDFQGFGQKVEFVTEVPKKHVAR